MEPGRGPRCPHGYSAPLIPAEEHGEGWVVPVAPAECRTCESGRVGIPFKPGKPPGEPRKRTIEEVAADIKARSAKERRVAPLPDDVCRKCGTRFGPSTYRVPAKGGGFRHAEGSPVCQGHVEPPPAPVVGLEQAARPVGPPRAQTASEEPCACPTCGRPVVVGAPYDLHEIRQALLDALKAVDDLIAGADNEREALEELDNPT